MMLHDEPLKSAEPAGEPGGVSVHVVGLVGGMGAGKSWLATELARAGALVIDADKVGHLALENPAVRSRLVETFGAIEDPADPAPPGARPIDRKALGAIVFADESSRQRLEAIVHPVMVDDFRRVIREAAERDRAGRPALVVLDAAILLEAGWDRLCHLVVLVDCPEEVRRARLRDERGWTDAEIDRRERAQWPLARKKELADLVVGPFHQQSDVLLATRQVREALAAGSPSPKPPASIEPEPASRI
jgi:dephospho-CoA kinase